MKNKSTVNEPLVTADTVASVLLFGMVAVVVAIIGAVSWVVISIFGMWSILVLPLVLIFMAGLIDS